MQYPLLLAVTLAACFALQSAALRICGGRTNKSESNYFSSLARIQTGVRQDPEIMLLGSSMTGRMPDRGSGFAGVANLGCDGGGAVDTLRAIDRGQLPGAPILVIEGNTLGIFAGRQETEIGTAIRSPWFQLGRRVPNFGATARPAAFVYSKLLAGKIGTNHGANGPALPLNPTPVELSSQPNLPGEANALVEELSRIIRRLQSRGTRCVITIIPPGVDSDSLHRAIARGVAERAGLPLFDLAAGLPDGAIRLTDGVHMDPPSAAATVRTILGVVR